MKTITVTVGESRYEASLLSVAETARATRALGEIQEAAVSGDFENVAASILVVTETVSESLKRAGSHIATALKDTATPLEIVQALAALIAASCGEQIQKPAAKVN